MGTTEFEINVSSPEVEEAICHSLQGKRKISTYANLFTYFL